MKDRTVMRADLRTDLKDSGSLWSDAELNRCVERAVSDLSRFLPRARVYEEVLDFDIDDESVTFPKDTDPDLVVDAQTFNGKTAGSTFTIAAQPDIPRVLTITVTDADNSITDWHIRIDGVDEENMGVSEDFYFGNGKTQTGKQIFKTVHAVTLVEAFGGSAAAGDVLDVGIGAYTDTWVFLSYKPVKVGSETATGDDDASLARNTDFVIDYAKGRVKAISGGGIAAEEVCTFSYDKNQTYIDLTSLDDFIRVSRVEYPVGNIPQSFCNFDLIGRYLMIAGSDGESQSQLSDGNSVRIFYDATHHPPTDYTPGTTPEFLENTVLMASAAYALLVYALKCEHQAVTDITTARTAIAAADSAETAVGTALTNVKKYLDNNSSSDAAGVLASIAALHDDVLVAVAAANTYLDAVAGDLTNADAVRDEYIDSYVVGGTEPDILAYLTSGDALINTIAEGGENERTPEMYAHYAQVVKDALVAAFEQDRAFYQQDATARTNAALGFVQEASQRLQDIQAYLARAGEYNSIAGMFAREAEDRLSQVAAYLQEAALSIDAVSQDLTMSDRFREEANARRDEVWSIWRDRREYIGDWTSASVRQLPMNT